jgi:hypothetical protein
MDFINERRDVVDNFHLDIGRPLGFAKFSA